MINELEKIFEYVNVIMFEFKYDNFGGKAKMTNKAFIENNRNYNTIRDRLLNFNN